MNTLIVAEIGINHNGSLDTALKLIDAAKESGADVAKFQTFQCELFKDWRKEGLKHLELSANDFITLNRHCESVGIKFASTAFDTPSLAFLLGNTDMAFIKIASGMPVETLGSNLPVIISTGRGVPEFDIPNPVMLLHCVSEYPTPIQHVNLFKIEELKKLGYPVGFSDHSANPLIGALAVMAGAEAVEAHITLDRKQGGFDHMASLDVAKFKQMAGFIRTAEKAFADVPVLEAV